jgi:hypothetical protein
MRFGQRIPLPSTVQIKHDVLMYGHKVEKEKARVLCAEVEGMDTASSWQEIADHYRARIKHGVTTSA